MKNWTVLIIMSAILASCSISNEQKKLEINRQMHEIVLQIKRNMDRQDALKLQLDKVTIDYSYDQQKSLASTTKLQAFRKKIEKIDLQMRQLEKQIVGSELKFRKLEQEYSTL